MSDAQERTPSHHLATVSHGGRFWDVYLEFNEAPEDSASHRAALAFSPADGVAQGIDGAKTAVILIEASYEAVVRKARAFTDHELVALLRSSLPD